MKADLTRYTFDPFKNFTRVLMQQGRVQLDADWNEQAAILLHYLQSLAAVLFGQHGGPQGNLGFQITDSTIGTDFDISPGHYYVDGILCALESPAAPVPISSIGTPPSPTQFQIPASSFASFTKNQPVLLVGGGQSVWTTIQNVTQANPTAVGVVTVPTVPDVSKVLSAPHPYAYYKFISYRTQPDYPGPPGLNIGQGLIYLDVWERLITYVEDDRIREVALDGADTAARSKLVCQVKQWAGGTADDLKSHFQPDNRGRLMAQAKQTSTSTDPCVIDPNASYSGPENQLYRVEIHTGSQDANGKALTPTFKWSRENGSVVFPIVSFPTGSATTNQVVLENLGRDDRFGLNELDWVEILDDNYVLLNIAGNLLQVQSIDSGNLSVTLTGALPPNLDQTKHPLLRRWDQTFGDPAQGGLQQEPSDKAAIIPASSADPAWLNLENGIQIQFQPTTLDTPNLYRTGDYWLIPARTATGDIEWPTGTARPPDGVDHHYAPLAATKIDASSVEVSILHQHVFGPLPLGA